MHMARNLHEQELETYRALAEPATEFKSGFGWSTVLGILFCGLIMMPGGIYLGLMTGGNLGAAASWVTVILFMEIARRAMKPMNTQQLVILLHAANLMMVGNMLFPGGPMGQLVYNAYLVGCDAVRDAGMLGAFPRWFAPPYDSPAITERTFFHTDWIVPIAVAFCMLVITVVQRYTLGYLFFRVTSDIERLPFPLAPVQAQGAMALAEAAEQGRTDDDVSELTQPKARKTSLRWRVFSLGAYIGIGFGFIQVGIPAITGMFLAKPFYLIPQPFVDTTVLTQPVLPATPTGMVIDLGIIMTGFVLPFWAVVGTSLAVGSTFIINPLLHYCGMLPTWQPGMDTVNTTFSNSIDFWLSFGIGSGLAIAVVSIVAMVRDVRRKTRSLRQERAGGGSNIWAPPAVGRGDCSLWIIGAVYALSAAGLVALCAALLPAGVGRGVLPFLVVFAFIYNPFISYVSARLLGLTGQVVNIPYIKEASFLLSGAKGVEIWLAPIPIYNFGYQAQSFRVNEITGVNFWSLVKTEIVALPVMFLLSLLFWSFIWHADAVPSAVFPAAQLNWELMSKNQVLLFSSTFVAPGEDPATKSVLDSEFMRAIHPGVIGGSFVGIIALYGVLAAIGLPVMLVYGLIRGFGALPHVYLLEIVGALLGRYYFQRAFGKTRFLQMAPNLLAGYFTGVGLISMATIAMRLIKAAVSAAPF
jgi:hypothetical protein